MPVLVQVADWNLHADTQDILYHKYGQQQHWDSPPGLLSVVQVVI